MIKQLKTEIIITFNAGKPKMNMAFIVGNEVDGLPKKILDMADIVVEIPMHGTKESLNVSVATGVALFRMLGR